MTTPSHDGILECLQRFQMLVNSNARVRRLLKGWEPVVLVEPTDADRSYYLRIADAEVATVALAGDTTKQPKHLVHVRGTGLELTRVFSGQRSAARAVLDATLEVFASDGDQVKLDAITLVLWGA